MPGKSTAKEVNEYVGNTFEIVATRLFFAEVVIDASESRSAEKAFVATRRDVLRGFGIHKSLSKSKVDEVDDVDAVFGSNEKVVGFDVAMDDSTRVNEFDAIEELFGDHNDRFQSKSTMTAIEEAFKRRSKMIDSKNKLTAIITEE